MKKGLSLLLLFLVLSHIEAKEFFISTKGSDHNNGQFESPFLTIGKASDAARPGDTITILGGAYQLNRPFSPAHSGTPEKWITYRGAQHENVVFDGSEVFYIEDNGKKVPFSNYTSGLFQIENVRYIRFENIKLVNSRAAGFIVRGPDTKKIDLLNCKTERTYNSGIGIWYADSVRVQHCEVVKANDIDFRNEEVSRPHEAPHEAISICGAKFFEVAQNHVHHCYKEGIDCKEISRHGVIHHNKVHDLPRQAYYVDAWFGLLEDIELHDNLAYNCAWGFVISVEGKSSELKNVRFHHNLIYNMTGAGILFGVWGLDGPRSDIHIYNNTIYKCGSPNWWSGGVGSITILSKNFRDIYIYRNILDKGWDFELGFTFPETQIKEELEKRNFIFAENLIEAEKNRPSRPGQFDLRTIGFTPAKNETGAPLYRNELQYDLVPEDIPSVKSENMQWKYRPSPWYGALEPVKK